MACGAKVAKEDDEAHVPRERAKGECWISNLIQLLCIELKLFTLSRWRDIKCGSYGVLPIEQAQ